MTDSNEQVAEQPPEEEEGPAEADFVPATGKPAFRCPHCGVYTVQHWDEALAQLILTGRVAAHEPIEKMPGRADPGTSWRRARCFNCKNVSVWRGPRMMWPQRGAGLIPNSKMSVAAKELFEEANGVATISRRAGAALARATLERILADLVDGNSLNERIRNAMPQVSRGLGQMLDVVRITGNEVLHPGSRSDLAIIILDDEEGPGLFELLLETSNRIVAELVDQPRQDQSWWSRLPQGVKDQIVRRDGVS